jgi:hypothetical protein
MRSSHELLRRRPSTAETPPDTPQNSGTIGVIARPAPRLTTTADHRHRRIRREELPPAAFVSISVWAVRRKLRRRRSSPRSWESRRSAWQRRASDSLLLLLPLFVCWISGKSCKRRMKTKLHASSARNEIVRKHLPKNKRAEDSSKKLRHRLIMANLLDFHFPDITHVGKTFTVTCHLNEQVFQSVAGCQVTNSKQEVLTTLHTFLHKMKSVRSITHGDTEH